MTVTYQWQRNLAAQFGGMLLSPQDQNRLYSYQARLAKLTQDGYHNLPLTELMRPLFELAIERSRNGGAVAENRALILVLALYVNQKSLHKFLPSIRYVLQPHWRFVTLNDRDDFAKHYLVSAMLAAYAGTPLADAVGVYKELEDSRGGSGFSFNDIAADLAGTRMGELSIQNEQQAQKIQNFLAAAKEVAIMPITDDLPEYLPAFEFNRKFGGLKGEAYLRMMNEIKHRISRLPISSFGII